MKQHFTKKKIKTKSIVWGILDEGNNKIVFN